MRRESAAAPQTPFNPCHLDDTKDCDRTVLYAARYPQKQVKDSSEVEVTKYCMMTIYRLPLYIRYEAEYDRRSPAAFHETFQIYGERLTKHLRRQTVPDQPIISIPTSALVPPEAGLEHQEQPDPRLSWRSDTPVASRPAQ